MYKLRDRVKALTTTEGTQDIVLGPSPDGFQSFQSVYAEGEEFLYNINHVEEDEWEVGVGALDSGGLLVRKQVQDGSNGTNKVSFSAGYKEVFVTASAAFVQTRASFGDPTSFGRLASYVSFHQDFGYNNAPLDPRITFSRSGTATYIKNGKILTSGVDEPVFEEGGLRLWGSVTNLYPSNDSLVADSNTNMGMDVSSVASIFEGKEAALCTSNGERSNPSASYPATLLEATKGYTLSGVVEVITNEMVQVGLVSNAGVYLWEGNKESLILEEGVEILTRRGPNNGMVLRFSTPYVTGAEAAQFSVGVFIEADVIGEQVAVHHYQIEEGETVGPMVWTDGQPETMPADNARIEGAAFSSIFNPHQGALVLPHSSFHMGDFSLNTVFVLAGPTYPIYSIMVTFKGPDGYLYLGGSNLPTQQIPNSDQDYVNLKLRWGSDGIDVFVGDTRVLSDTPLPTNWGEADRLILADELSAGKYIDRLAMLTEAPTDSNMEGM